MRKSNRVLAALLSILMIISMLPVFAGAAAYGFSDFPTGTWSEEAVTAAVNNGLLQGKGGGIIAPRDNLTRAEAAAVINRAFGATVKADISEYTDVNPGDWYYSEFQKAVNMGTIVGEGDGILNPNGYITREAMFTVVARALVLSDTTAGSLSRFVDGSDTSVWAASYVSAMAKRGYVNGDNEGRLNPQAYITREEFAQVMHNIFKTYISTSGNVAGAVYGTTVIRVPNVTLTNVTISGDLILGDGVGAGDVIMNNVKVSGRILCRGGEGKVQFISGCSVGEMVVVHDINGVVNFHNYRNEKIFDCIVLDTEATFLGNVSFNTGGSSSSSKKNAYYKIHTYIEDVDKEGEYTLVSTENPVAKKGNTITYTPDDKYGFVIDTDKSVLSGTNNGSLEIKVYYKRDTFKVTLNGTEYDYRYQEPISKDTVLADIIANKKVPASVDKGYKIEGYYTEEKGKGDKVGTDYVVEGAITVYPHIVTIPYDIEYKLNGGTLPAVYDKTYTVDKTVTLPVPTKGTSKFLGWYKDAEFKDGPYETIPALAAPGDGSEGSKYVFYARWPDNANFTFKVASTTDTEVRVNVLLDKIPEDIENGIKNMVINYTYTGTGANALVHNPLTGVIPNAGIGGSVVGSENGIIRWTGNAFTALPTDGVLFTLVFTKDKFATGEVTFTYGDITLTNDTESSTAFDTAPLTFDIGTGKTKITVKYKDVEYSVYEDEKLYDALNGTTELSDVLKPLDEDEVPAGFTHQGFKFDGENGLITPDTIAKYTMNGKVIVPNFVAIKYDIIYDVNTNDTSAKINGVPVLTLDDVYDIDTYKDNNLYKLHGLTTAAIVRDGYTFVGWHLKKDLSDAAITHIPNKLLPEGNATGITVYAEWEQNAVLGLYTNAATDKENLVIDVILNKLPVGTTGITSVTFEYDLTATDANAGIDCKNISSTVGTVVRNGNKITWTGDISSISNAGVTLFTITFSKNREATGNVTIDFVDDKATILDATGKEVTYGYDVKGITTTVDGDQLFKIEFDEKTYEAYAGDKLSTAAIDLDAAVKELLVDALNAYEPEEHYEFKNGKKFIINGAEYTIDQIKEIVVNGDITITSAETPIEYTVKYMDGSSDAAFDAAVTVDYSYNIDEPISSLPTPASKADEGLKFASWHTDASLSDASKVNSVDINSPRDNNNVTTLYAKWDAIEYKLIYVLNGGKVGATTGEYEVTLDVDTLGGKKYTLINENDVEWAEPQNPKYFKGWYKDAALTTPIDKIDDITKLDPENPMYVYADWSGESVLSLSYKPVTVEKDTTEIMVYVELSDFPKDIGIDDLSAITIDYIMEGNSEGILTYKGVKYVRVDGAGKPLGTTNGTFKNNADGRIVWNANSSADRLTEIDSNKALFVITFAREDLTKGGKVKVKIDGAELANYNAKIATGYTIDPNGIVIDIPDGYYTVHYNGTDYDVAENAKLDTNTNLINAINAKLNTQNTDGYEWVVYADGASGKNEIDVTTYEVKEDITITIVEEPIPYTITYYIYNDDTKAFEQYGNVDDYNVKDMVNSTYDLLAPTKSGFTFIGWYDKETFTDSDAKINAITKLGNYKFYGKWIEQVGTINYYAHAIDESSKTVKIDVKINELPEEMEDISVLRLYYDLEDADGELEYVKTELNPGLGLSGNFEHKLGAMTWAASGMTIMPMSEGRAAITTMADGVITKELLEANNNVVATITFNVNMKDDDWDGSVHATIKTSDNQIHMKDSDGKEPDSYVGSSATVSKAAKPFTITYELGTNGKFDGESPKTTYTIEDTDYDLTVFKPVREGYVFEYWYEGTTDKKVTTIPASEWLEKDAKVYTAKWRKENPVLTFVKLSSTDTEVKVGVTLEDIPNDVDNLKSMELTYDMDVDLLKYKDTALYDGIPGTITEKADGTIKWATDKALTSEDMMTLGNILFEITFTKDLATEGDVTFTYTDTKLTDADGTDARDYKPTDAIISLTKADSIVVKVHKGKKYIDDIPVEVGGKITQTQLDAIIPQSEYVDVEGYTDSDGNVHKIMPEYWYQDGKEWKLFDLNTPIMEETNVYLMTAYVSASYETDLEVKGIKIPKIELAIAYDSNTEIIKSGLDALTAFGTTLESMLYDLKEHGGFDPYEFALEKATKTGFVDADGNLLNPLIPIPLDKIVTEDLIMKEIDIYIDANIDNEEFIRDILRHDSVEKMLLEDEQLKHNAMGDPEIRSIFLTDDFIKEIIKDDIENNNSAFVNDIINNTDFASTVINNDSVLDYVLNNEEIRAKVLESGTTFKLKIVDTGAQHIENVYFGDTVDAELKSYIETELKSKAVKGELKVIIENSGEIRAVLKTTLETDEDAKAILKTELLEMLQNPQTNSEIKAEVENYLIANKNVVKDEVTSYIKDNKNSTSIKNTVVQYIKAHKNDKLIKDAVVDYITTNKNNTTIKNTIVSYIKDHKNDDLIKGTVKSYLEEHMNDATVRGTVVDYIEKHSEEDTIKDRVIDYIVSNVDDFKADDKRTDILSNQTVRTQFVNAYESVTIGTVWEDVDADTFIDKFINAPSELKAIDESTYNNIVAEYKKAIEDNIEEYATSNYTTLFSDYFNETYLNSKADSESEKTVYEKLFEDNLNAIMNDTATYETLFDANIDKITGDKDKYEELFSNNVTSIVNDKVKDPQTNKTVYETLFDDNVDAIISDDTKDSETGKTPYETLFDDNVDTIINDNTKDSETGKTAYETLFDDNFSTYYNSLGTDEFNNLVNTHFDSFYTSQYDSLFDEYFDDYFDEIFDSLYEANVEKWANIAYDEPTTTATVRSTIKNVVTRLVDEYIAGAKDADDDVEVESGLKSMVDKVIAQVDIKATLRENYNNDGDFKTAVDQLIKDNASMIVSDYAYEKLDDASETTIRDIIHTQVEKLVDDYVNYNMDKDLQEFIDAEINKHMKEYIDGYIAGDSESVEMLEKLVPTYAHTAVEALKKTPEFKNTITDFMSGKGVRVNEGNIVFIEILDELMHTYNYDKLASDFLPENIQKVVDLIGHDIVADIVNAYFAEFCRLMDDAIAKFNAEYKDGEGNTAAEYTFSTRPAVRINYMDIVEIYYNKVMDKVKPKLNSKQFIANNPYVQKLLAKDWILEFLDYDASKVSEEMSGYSIKKGHYDEETMEYGSPIVRYYDILLENAILVHDAVMWYNTLGEASLEDKLDAVSHILGVYANKANNVIMHYIETGELPKGYTPYELADKFLGKVLGVNDKVDSAYDKVEDFYEKHEDKITEYIDKAKNFYEDYLDRDYTEIIDLANLSVYADGNAYEVYKILLEMSEENNAFNIDTLATAIFDSTNYHGVNKIEDVMMKIKSKLEGLKYEPVTSLKFIRDAYTKTVAAREVKGYNTGRHTVDAQRYLQYITD
ncbi:MAG: S-layer homology domain-containing protein [Clostridia bacterium]|nr:S-layer homology domain-containing protein [Clostridia bacterium]